MTPDKHTISEHHLEVDAHHTLYVHEWGNPAGRPIFNLHGGPGGESKDKYKAIFDPEQDRVIFFDQRGCGKSLPYGSLHKNTTQNLIGDIDKIADYLQIGKFSLIGGSWGSCLVLAYAVVRPERVNSIVITGIFTGTKSEISWLDQGLFQTFFPDVWQRYLDDTPKSYRRNPSEYHFKRILEGSNEEQKSSAYTYHNLEGGIVMLDDRFMPENYDDYNPAGTRIEVHYLANNCFLENAHIINNAHELTMPVYMVQGRYDMVCPPKTAFALHGALPNSQLVTTLSGHVPQHEDIMLIRQFLKQR